MDSLREDASRDEVRKAVIDTALAHSLVSKYTSLVAVADNIARDSDTPLMSRDVPLNLPQGWDYEKVFGDLLKKAAPPAREAAPEVDREARTENGEAAERLQRDMRVARAAPTAMHAFGQPVQLPSGATPAPLHTLVGWMFLSLAVAMGLLARRRRRA